MTQRRDSVFSDIILNEPGDKEMIEQAQFEKTEEEETRHRRLHLIMSMMSELLDK